MLDSALAKIKIDMNDKDMSGLVMSCMKDFNMTINVALINTSLRRDAFSGD